MQHVAVEYTLNEAVQDGVLKIIGEMDGRPLVVTRAIDQTVSLPKCLEYFRAFSEWRHRIAPELPEQDRWFSEQLPDGSTIWVVEDGSAYTLMFPADY